MDILYPLFACFLALCGVLLGFAIAMHETASDMVDYDTRRDAED